MAVKDLGIKLSCQNCEAKFYDLKKKTPVCPKCDTEYVVVKPRARRAAKAAVEEPKAAPVAEKPANDDSPETEDDVLLEVEVEVEDDDDEDDDSLMEDTSDIGGDEDDLAGVVVNIDTSSDNKDT